MAGPYLPNRAGKQARLEAAARAVDRAWDALMTSEEEQPGQFDAVVDAIGELRAALAHPTDDGRYRGRRG